MSHSLTIKEDSYINMFYEKEKAISNAKETRHRNCMMILRL